MHMMFQTRYELQYLTLRLIGYMNAPSETAFLALYQFMDYIMHHPHEPIMYSRNKVFKNNESLLQFFFNPGKDEMNQTQQY